jgi:hypothetical protein
MKSYTGINTVAKKVLCRKKKSSVKNAAQKLVIVHEIDISELSQLKIYCLSG